MTVSIKSKFFKTRGYSEDGKKQLKTTFTLSEESLAKILSWFEQSKSYPRFDDDDVTKLAEITNEPGEIIIEGIAVFRNFVNNIIKNEENPKDFKEDLISLNLIEKKNLQKLDLVFEKLPAIVEKFSFFRRKNLTESYSLPQLTKGTYSAVIKPVYEHPFEYGKDSVENYNPKPFGYTVVAQMEFQKSDSEHTFSFQVNRDNFNRFISDLLALQTEMENMYSVAENLMEAKDE